MDNTNNRERLSKLLAKENERTVQSTLDSCDTDFIPSKRFLQNMDRMIKNAQSGRALTYKPPIRKYVTVAVICVVLLASIILAASSNSISYIGDVIRGEFSEIFGGETATSEQPKIDTEYLPSFVPMGFTESEVTSLPAIIRYAWVNSEGESLVFIQQIGSESNIFEEDNLIFGEMKTQNTTVTVAHNDTIVHYVWTAHGYSFKISAYPTLSSTLVARMIDSITEKK